MEDETNKTKISSSPKPLQELNLMDRFLFAEAMEDPEIMQDVLQIILGHPIELAEKPQTEKEERGVT